MKKLLYLLISSTSFASSPDVNSGKISAAQKIIDAANSTKPNSNLELTVGSLSEPGEWLEADENFEDGATGESWLQQGLLVTDNYLNAAIAGQGFFKVIDGDTGAIRFTRYGDFKIDVYGNLVHSENGDQVLQHVNGGIASIHITDYASTIDQRLGKAFNIQTLSISDDGVIAAKYENGEVRDLARLVVSTFEHPRFLNRIGRDLFEATDASGMESYDGKNQVFGATLELHDEGVFKSMGFDPISL